MGSVHHLGHTGNRRVSGRWTPGVSGNPATRFQPGASGNPKGRPRTKIIRDFARKVAEEKDPTGQRLIAEELVHILLKYARRGSLGHLMQFIQLVESDEPGAGWNGSEQLDGDAIARLYAKLCRAS
jgi:hypothetical protein